VLTDDLIDCVATSHDDVQKFGYADSEKNEMPPVRGGVALRLVCRVSLHWWWFAACSQSNLLA
jgi:hypothetical protein